MIEWQHFPKSSPPADLFLRTVRCFETKENEISSGKHRLDSNGVLDIMRPALEAEGYGVEDKKANHRIMVPVLFGRNGDVEKAFHVDGYHEAGKTVLEIEAGRAKTNYQFLKDFFEACAMIGVDYQVLAVRLDYRGNRDFEDIVTFFDTLYASGRLGIPLKGILVIGY